MFIYVVVFHVYISLLLQALICFVYVSIGYRHIQCKDVIQQSLHEVQYMTCYDIIWYSPN